MSERNDGGPAFPSGTIDVGADQVASPIYDGMSLRDWFAGHAPTPSDSEITLQQQIDKSRNPYNESHKPHLRSRTEIIASLNYAYADAMLQARES